MESLGISLENIAKQIESSKPLSKEWQRAIVYLDKLGAEKEEEHRRRAYHSYREAERMIHGD